LDRTERNHNDYGHEGELDQVLQYIYALLFSVNPSQDIPEYIRGAQKAEKIISALVEARRAMSMASKGDFSYEITTKGFLPGTLKALQANLNHLEWMTRRIASGDMEQRVSFMGGFSEAFNSMVEQLSSTLKKLREEEERWHLAMLCSRDGVWEIDLKSNIPPYFSPRLFELLGFSQEDMPAIADWPKFFQPGDHVVLTLYRRFVTQNSPPDSFKLDHKLCCADGKYRWFLTRGMTLFDPATGAPLRLIGVTAGIQDRKEREEYFSYRATHDVLTGLPNRILFDEHLKNGMAIAKRTDSYLGIVMVDLDKFKYINDTFGHDAGDQVLVEVANRLQKSKRESDMASRFGGDEFALILAFSKDELPAITKVLQRAMVALNKPFLINDVEMFVTASFGVSIYPNDGESPRTLMMHADEAMYYAKALGRNACAFWKRGKKFNVLRFDTE